MKYLLDQVAKYFDDYQEELNKSWLDEYNRAKEEKAQGKNTKFDVASVMAKQPKISLEKFTKMFTEAQERIDEEYRTKKAPKTGLFSKKNKGEQ